MEKVTETKKEVSQEELNELYQNAINTALEMELAFKLMSYRVTTQLAFIQRVADLSEYTAELWNKITQDGTASFDIATRNSDPKRS